MVRLARPAACADTRIELIPASTGDDPHSGGRSTDEMTTRLRTTWLAGGVALLFALTIGGAALGADTVGQPGTATDEPAAPLLTEVTATFVDVDGDGIADTCDSDVVADPDAAAAAEMAVDANGDGAISVSEAAHSSRIGGTNCNHGGYVSTVAKERCGTDSSADADAADGAAPTDESEAAGDETAQDEAACDDDATDETETEAETATEDAAAPEPCVEVAAPTFDPAALALPGGFGAYVSSVARSDAIGGKNCNHGGAVSEAVHAAKAVAKAQRDAAKAAAKAERDAAKAERAASKGNKGKGQAGGQ
jgi:hypothetical protein